MNFKEAFREMKSGLAVKLPSWSGYWWWDEEAQTILMYTKDGGCLDIRETVDVTSDNARMIVNGEVYEILLIDDPMNMHDHLEIYLRFIGGQ